MKEPGVPSVHKRKVRKAGFKPKLERYASIHNHRVYHVRSAARAAHLAHAYLTCMPYARVEDPEKTRSEPDFDAILAILANLQSFGPRQFTSLGKTERFDAIRSWIRNGAPVIDVLQPPKKQEGSPAAA